MNATKKQKVNYIKYDSTVGLRTHFSGINKTFLAKVFFGKRDDGTGWDMWVESGNNGSFVKALGIKSYTNLPKHIKNNLEELELNPYNTAAYAAACLAVFGGEV